jgi:hypothetical protein
MPTHDDLWIRRNEIRPLWRDRANGYIIDTEQKALSIAVIPLTYARELSAAQRVERMRYPHKTRGCDRITCISNGATSGWSGVTSAGLPPTEPARSPCVPKNWRC